MIVAQRKKIPEIFDVIQEHKNVLVLGCGTCVTVCLAGGEREVSIISSALRIASRKQGKKIKVNEFTIERQCDNVFIEGAAEEIKKAQDAQENIQLKFDSLDRARTPEQKLTAAKSLADELRASAPERMSPAKHKEILDELYAIDTEMSRTGGNLEKAEKRLSRALKVLGTFTIGYSANEYGLGKWLKTHLFGGR